MDAEGHHDEEEPHEGAARLRPYQAEVQDTQAEYQRRHQLLHDALTS
jgi:hypothetical protein